MPICQNVPAPPSWLLPSANEVFIVLVPSRLHPSEPFYEPPEMWPVHQRTLMGQERTNNFDVAAHRRMRDALVADDPTIWRFIEGLRRVQAGRDKDYED
ncbi:hypothetical protein M514_28636, partial [Trichuris suis]